MATHERQPLLAGGERRGDNHGHQGVVALVLFSLLCMLQGLSWDPWAALPKLSQREYGFDTTTLTWQQNANKPDHYEQAINNQTLARTYTINGDGHND